MGASRLQQIAVILSVPVTFFFEGAPQQFRQTPKHNLITSTNFWQHRMA